jgi:hypothetical protein
MSCSGRDARQSPAIAGALPASLVGSRLGTSNHSIVASEP